MASIVIDGAALTYHAEGEGAPVIALHGSASTGAQWRSLVGYIGGRFRVFTPDLPGYGRSEAPRREAGLAGDAAAIAALVERIGGRVHLVGHSYGAAVALKLATLRPELAKSLTVVEPVAFQFLRDGAAGDRALYREFTGLAAATHRLAAEGDRVAAMRGFIDYWNGAGAWDRTSARLQGFFLGCLPRVCADFRAVMAEDGDPAPLARVACPALAVMGLESPAPSLRVTEAVAEALPRAALHFVPDAGHLAPLTDPHVVDPLIAEHLVAAEKATVVPFRPAIAA